MLPLCQLALGQAVRIGRLGELAHVFCGVKEVDELVIRVQLVETPIACCPAGDSEVECVHKALLGAPDLVLQALEKRLLAVPGGDGEAETVLAFTVMIVKRQGTHHGFAVARTVGHRDHDSVEAAHPVGDVLNVRRWRLYNHVSLRGRLVPHAR